LSFQNFKFSPLSTMKNLIIIIASSCIIYACNSNSGRNLEKRQNAELTNVHWNDTIINLGTINHGEPYHFSFNCTNIGKVPLIFQKMESTCGCTVIERYIRTPILPSKQDSVTGTFKLLEPSPNVERKIYIMANTKQEFYILRIKANVI